MKNFLKFLFSVKNEYSGFSNFFKTKIICILGLKIKIKNVGKFLLKGTVVPFCVSVCIRFSQNAETKKMKNQKL